MTMDNEGFVLFLTLCACWVLGIGTLVFWKLVLS